jgi:hypothetical protein
MIPTKTQTGYGGLGILGGMGYPILLSVNGVFCEHGLSAHPPSSLRYTLHQPFQMLTCHVALNDSSSDHAEANFLIYADGVLQAVAARVRKGDPPRYLEARLHNARQIELVIESRSPEGCHALWVDPILHETAPMVLTGVLNRTHILMPNRPRVVRRCIGVVADDQVASMADNFLGSLYRNGNVKDCHVVILTEEGSELIPQIAQKFGAQMIEVRRVVDYASIWIKTAVYSLAHIVQADQYLIFDIDMLVIDQVRALFHAMETSSDLAILAARESWIPHHVTLGHLINEQIEPYGGQYDGAALLRMTPREYAYNLIVNGGVFGGGRKAMLALDNTMRAMSPQGIVWMDQRIDLPWREQALFNLALARLECGHEIDERYNTQLLRKDDVVIHIQDDHILSACGIKPVNVLHYNGDAGRAKYQGMEEFYRHVSPCKFGGYTEEGLESYLSTLFEYASKQVQEGGVFNAHIYETLLNMDNVLRFIGARCRELKPESILDMNTLQGAIGGCLAHYAADYGSKITRISEAATPLFDMISEQAKDIEMLSGNLFVSCKKLVKEGRKFDLIALDTSLSEKNTAMLILLAAKLLNAGGSILIHDRCNPLCDMDIVAQKLRQDGLKIESNRDFRPTFENQKVYLIGVASNG